MTIIPLVNKKTIAMTIKIMHVVCFTCFLSSGGGFGPCVRYKNFLDKEDVRFHCGQTLRKVSNTMINDDCLVIHNIS